MSFQKIKDFLIKLLIKFKILILIGIVIFIALKAFEMAHMRITAVFTELQPFSNINVYYKGFKIGRTVKVIPSKDFMSTRVTIILNSWDYKLPNNIKAKVQKARKDSDIDYMEIIYPNSPSLIQLKYGDIIEGEISHDWNDIINNAADGGFDELKGNANNLLGSANEAAKSLSKLLATVNSIMEELQPDLTSAVNSLSSTCENLNRTSSKLERSIDDQIIANSFLNVHNTTKNFESTTLLINTRTIPILNSTLCSLKSLFDNVNMIVKGVGQTLQKRMGGARLIFGTPVSKN